MSPTKDEHLQDAAILTRAVENVFRKLIRFLVGRISLVKLQEMIRFIFIEEAENKIKKESPNKNVPLTKLALLSGIDTRTLIKVRNSVGYRQPLYKESNFLKEFTPGAAILDVWSSRPPYIEVDSGKIKSLKISGSEGSFESLFSECIRGRGITYKSLLHRLIESGSVSINKKLGTVSLLKKAYLPVDPSDQLGSIQMGFSAIGNMLDTVIHNVESLETGRGKLFQQGVWTYRLLPRNRPKIRSDLRQLLDETDKKAREIICKYEENKVYAECITSGVSLFYFEEYQ
ncbi:MAG: hypothetical protein V3S21_03140 [Xanthomonadales bacterium]